MKIVLDAGVVVAIVADDETSDYARAVLEACAEREVVVPALWRWEVAETFVVLERKGCLPDAAAAFAYVARNFPVSVANDARLARAAKREGTLFEPGASATVRSKER